MIPLIGHHLLDCSVLRHHLLEVLGRFDQRRDHRRRISLVRSLNRDRYNRSCLQIHRVFRFVCQTRAPILHLGDASIRIVRVFPLLVGSFLLALAVQLHQLLAGRRFDSRRLSQPLEKLVVPFPAIPSNDAAQRGIGFQRGRIDAQRLSLQRPGAKKSIGISF